MFPALVPSTVPIIIRLLASSNLTIAAILSDGLPNPNVPYLSSGDIIVIPLWSLFSTIKSSATDAATTEPACPLCT